MNGPKKGGRWRYAVGIAITFVLGVFVGSVITPIPEGASIYDDDEDVWRIALLCAQMSDAVYIEEGNGNLTEACEGLGFPNMRHFSQGSHFAVVCSNDSKVVIAFRGTNDPRDWITNANVASAEVSGGSVHKGFYEATMLFYRDVLDQAKSYGGRNKEVYVTGHSLGGAMAMLFCYESLSRRELEVASLFTFGQPLAARKDVAKRLNQGLGKKYWRFVNGNDLVTRLIPTFYHAGTRIHLSPTGLTMREPGLSIRGAEEFDVDMVENEAMSEAEFERLKGALTDSSEEAEGNSGANRGAERGEVSIADHSMTEYISRIRQFGVNLATENVANAQIPLADTLQPLWRSYQGSHFALLIGCTKYPGLRTNTKSYDLIGPNNDVDLYETLLTQKYGFPKEAIVKLIEDRTGIRNHGRPTRENIRKAFMRLKEVAGPQSTVFIAFSGHGSQQPDQNPDPKIDPEPDGWDEILLPADAQRAQSGQIVPNAIVDDDLRSWLGALNSTASVCLVLDACQSGTASRGQTARSVPADHLFVQNVEPASAPAVSERGLGIDTFESLKLGPNVVAIYAALPTEVTIELPLPPRSDSRKVYGILSYTLNHVLTNAETRLSYRGLVDRIYAQYGAWSRTSPTPLVEGKNRDKVIMENAEVVERQILLTRKLGQIPLTINAGRLNGLSAGSILAVRPPEGAKNSERVLGHVIVQQGARVLDARVSPVAYGGLPAPAQESLVSASRCEPVLIHLGEKGLKVGVEGAGDENSHRAAILASELKSIGNKPGALFRTVDDPTNGVADWVVEVDNDGVFLVREADLATRLDEGENQPRSRRFRAPEQQTTEWLEESLAAIARAELLKRFATKLQNGRPPVRSKIDLESQYMLLKDVSDTKGPLFGSDSTVKAGQLFGFSLKNKSEFAVDVGILFIDAKYGIHVYFPESSLLLNNRLPPRQIEPTLTEPGIIGDDAVGQEHMILMAVKSKAKGQPYEFEAFKQDAIDSTFKGRLLRTSLEDQLAILFPESPSRSLRRPDIEVVYMKIFSWITTE